MKHFILGLLLIGSILYAANIPALEIDNFDDGVISENPAWWTFGDSEQKAVDAKVYANSPLGKYLGEKALAVTGYTTQWYIGGMGLYLAKDATEYTHVKLYVYGSGPKSGRLTIQLYDDDNLNTKLEQDIENNYEPIFDDKFEYTQNVIWKGWKVLIIPISKFKDVNRTVGDNIWNPNVENGSGGLLHFQFVFLANGKEGGINIAIDNIKLVRLDEKK